MALAKSVETALAFSGSFSHSAMAAAKVACIQMRFDPGGNRVNALALDHPDRTRLHQVGRTCPQAVDHSGIGIDFVSACNDFGSDVSELACQHAHRRNPLCSGRSKALNVSRCWRNRDIGIQFGRKGLTAIDSSLQAGCSHSKRHIGLA